MVEMLTAVAAGVIGLVVGGAATWWALRGGGHAAPTPPGSSKLTATWHLRELGTPVVVVGDLLDATVPRGSRVLASGIVTPAVLADCHVEQVPPVRVEFALDLDRRRALLFTAGCREGTLAVLTRDEATVARLETEFRTLVGRASEYVERLAVRDLAGKDGVTVETQGIVQDVLPWKERFMLRLEDDGHIIGVVVDRDPQDLREEKVLVKGKVEKDGTGYAVVVAQDLRRIR